MKGKRKMEQMLEKTGAIVICSMSTNDRIETYTASINGKTYSIEHERIKNMSQEELQTYINNIE